jgi:hypothetical protein
VVARLRQHRRQELLHPIGASPEHRQHADAPRALHDLRIDRLG